MFDWISGFVQSSGYLGVALMMFAENVFPPIPSELIMPLAGFAVRNGEMSAVLAVLAGSAGSLAGAFLWYLLARRLGLAPLKRAAGRHGRWLTLTPQDIDDADRWFDRHGAKAVLFGRLVPAVRTLISVPAGLSGMPTAAFLIYSSIGTIVWTAFLTAAGYFLGSQYQSVQTYLNPVSNILIGVIVVWYLYRVVTWRPSSA